MNCSASKSSLKISKQTTGHIKIAVWFLLTNFDGNVHGGQTALVLSHPSHAITWFVGCDQSSATLCLEKKSYQRDFQDTYMCLHLEEFLSGSWQDRSRIGAGKEFLKHNLFLFLSCFRSVCQRWTYFSSWFSVLRHFQKEGSLIFQMKKPSFLSQKLFLEDV